MPGAAGQAGEGGSGLKRCLGLRDVVGFGLGVTIGGGIYVAMGAAALEAGPGVVASFLLAAIGCGCSGLCYAEMATLAPSSGGSYSFSYHAVGELPAYVTGIVNVCGNILSGAAVARGWVAYVASLVEQAGVAPPRALVGFEFGSFLVSPAAVVLVVLLGFINLMGTRATSTLNGVITFTSCVLLVVYVLFGSSAVDPARWFPLFPYGIGGVVRGASDVFFAYLGFDALACLGEEAEDPKVVPRGIILTLIISTGLYCFTAVTFTGLVSGDEIDIGAPLAMAAQMRGLNMLSVFISISAVGNTLTSVVSGILGSPRICYAMAQDGLLPVSLTRVNKHGTPVRALWLTIVPMALCAGVLEFEELADIVSAGALCSFSLVCCSLVILRSPDGLAEELEELQLAAAAPRDRSPSSRSPSSRSPSSRSPSSAPAPLVLGAQDAEGLPHAAASAAAAAAAARSSSSAGRSASGANRHRVAAGLGAYAGCCFCADMLLSLPDGGPAAAAAAALFGLGAAAAATSVSWPFWRGSSSGGGGGSGGAGGKEGSPIELRLPLMPLLPLVGLFFNMLLLAHVPHKALWRTFGLDMACLVFYFVYAAPGSRLREEEQPLTEERIDA